MEDFNKMIILGTGGKDENGNICITNLAKQRIHRAIEEAAIRDFSLRSKEPFMLIAGGYSSRLFDTRPATSEAKLMADYALRTYKRDGLTANAILLEEESTNTDENITNSLSTHFDFFQETITGERKLGFVSHDTHVERAVIKAAEVLPCSLSAIAKLAIRDLNIPVSNIDVVRDERDQLPLAGDD